MSHTPKRPATPRHLDQLSPQQQRPLRRILTELGIAEWDICLIGDGSGSLWGNACAWACMLVEGATGDRAVVAGGFSDGTNNLAELMAYVQALNWYEAYIQPDPAQGCRRGVILTDSQYISTTGTRLVGGHRASLIPAHGGLWAALEHAHRLWCRLSFHHLPRTALALNVYADALAYNTRAVLAQLALATSVATAAGAPAALHGLNPDPPAASEEPLPAPGKRGRTDTPVP